MGYFKPLRRKIGVLTLMMACVFTSAWIRSMDAYDVMFIPVSNATTIGVISAAGKIDFCRCWKIGSPEKFWLTTGSVRSSGVLLDGTGNINAWSDEHTIDWRFDLGEIRVAASRIEDRHDFDCILPYSSIVVPLTLLSAWLLLLSKPRAKKPADK